MPDRRNHFFNRPKDDKHDSSPIETLTELIFALNKKIAELSAAQDATNKRLDALTIWLTQQFQHIAQQATQQQKKPSRPPYFVPRSAAEVGGLVALVVLALVVLAVALSK